MKIDVKLIIKHLIGFVLLTVITYYTISYASYGFEIPFLTRTASDIDNTDNILSENNNELEFATEPPEIENLQNIVNPDDLVARTEPNDDDNSDDYTEPPPESESNALAFASVDELTAKGFYKSDGVYSAEENSLYKYDFAQVIPEYEQIGAARTVQTSVGRKNIVDPFMDYIFIHRPENIILCDWTGKIITENLSYHEESTAMRALEARDTSNNPVFYQTRTENITAFDEDGNEISATAVVHTYFTYDSNAKVFLQTDYDPIFNDRGVPFMYPSYYGVDGADNLSRYEIDGKWGYLTSDTQETVIPPAFDMAYNFSENVGIAYIWEQIGTWRGYQHHKRLYFLNDEGGYYTNNYFAPDYAAFEHLGFFYFDNGLTRAYYREFDVEGRVTVERDILVDKYGGEFYVPVDYNIKAYSNGVILLEKNGYYGFMSHTGDWIAQPIYTYAQPFSEGLAVIGFRNGNKGLIDTKGNVIVRLQYDHISSCSGGIIALHMNNQGWTILAKMRTPK